MEIAYLTIIVLTHVVFALVFLFLHRQQYGVLRYFAVAWIMQAIRALLLLEDRRGGNVPVPGWVVQDIASLVFTALLLLGSAYFVKKQFSRRRVILYFSLTIAVVLAIRFLTPDSFFQAPITRNLACLFFTMVIGTIGRAWAMIWFFQVWRKTRFSGALIAAISLVFPLVMAIVAPLQAYHSPYYPPQIHLFWFLQGLGLSLGVIMLVLTEQGAERVTAQRALGASEERYRKLFERSPLPMFVFDLETLRFMAVNKAAVRHYGYPQAEFLSMTMADIRPHDEIPALLDAVARSTTADVVGSRRRHRTQDGRIINVEANSHELDFQGKRARMVIINDVTERDQLEERLRLSQRLEAVGRLAGGIAHDFNNLLTAILGTSELLLPRVGPAERAELNEIRNAGERGAALVRQLLAFGRKQMLEPRVLDLNALVGEIGKLLERALGKDIELCIELDTKPCPVKADPGQLEQVLLNLALNARDSMPDGGRLTIRTRQNELSESESERRGYSILPGKYSVLVVS
ncbi:MAG: PAS domain S-box protein, partial [Acidobacteriota bacterium]